MKESNDTGRHHPETQKGAPDVWKHTGEIFSRLIRAQFEIMSTIATDLKSFERWVGSILDIKGKLQVNSNIAIIKSIDLNQPELQYNPPGQKMTYTSMRKLFSYFTDYLGSLKISPDSSYRLFEAFLLAQGIESKLQCITFYSSLNSL